MRAGGLPPAYPIVGIGIRTGVELKPIGFELFFNHIFNHIHIAVIYTANMREVCIPHCPSLINSI